MILNQFDLYFPLCQFYDNDLITKEIQITLVLNHFDLEFILTYNIANYCLKLKVKQDKASHFFFYCNNVAYWRLLRIK